MADDNGMKNIQALSNQMLGVGEAASAEEITQQSVSKEEPAYGRYETRYAQRGRERERHKEVFLIIKNATVTK